MVIDYSKQSTDTYYLMRIYCPRIDEIISNIANTTFSVLRSAYHQVPIKLEDKLYTAFEAWSRLYQFSQVPFGVTNFQIHGRHQEIQPDLEQGKNVPTWKASSYWNTSSKWHDGSRATETPNGNTSHWKHACITTSPQHIRPLNG